MAQAAATEDRGDDFTPTDEANPEAEAAVETKPGEEEEAADVNAKDDEETEGEEEKKSEPESKESRDRRIRIPKWRLDEAVSRGRAREEQLNARIQALEAESAAAAQTTQKAGEVRSEVETLESQIADLDDKYDSFIADGEKEKAATVRRERRLVERALQTAESEYFSAAAKEQAKAEFYYEAALKAVEATYVELNPENEEFDAELAEDVAGMRDALVSRGVTPATALERAVHRVLGAPKEPAPREKTATNGTKATRDAAAKSAAAKAAAGSPPRTDGIGKDSDQVGAGLDKASVLLMNQDEFAKLSDDKKAELRGDVM